MVSIVKWFLYLSVLWYVDATKRSAFEILEPFWIPVMFQVRHGSLLVLCL